MELKMLAQCEPLELVRANLNGVTEWAIVGVRSQLEFPLVALTGRGSPHVVRALGDMGLTQEFEAKPVLSYGKKYVLRESLVSPCDVHDGSIFQQNGALIFTNEGEFLRCIDRDRPRFLCLKTGVVRNEPSAQKAAFAEWGIWHGMNDNMIVSFLLDDPDRRA